MGQIGRWYPGADDGKRLVLNTGQMEALVPGMATGEVVVVPGDTVEIPTIVEQTPTGMHVYDTDGVRQETGTNVHVHPDPVTGEETVLVITSASDLSAQAGPQSVILPSIFSDSGPVQDLGGRRRGRRDRTQDGPIFQEQEVDGEDSRHSPLVAQAAEGMDDPQTDVVVSPVKKPGRLAAFIGAFARSLDSTELQATEEVGEPTSAIDPLLRHDHGATEVVQSSTVPDDVVSLPDVSTQDVVMQVNPSTVPRVHRLEDVRVLSSVQSDGALPRPRRQDRMITRPQLLGSDGIGRLVIALGKANEQLALEGYGPTDTSDDSTTRRRHPVFLLAAAGVAAAGVSGMVLVNHEEDGKGLSSPSVESAASSTLYQAPDFSTLPQDTVVSTTVVIQGPESTVASVPETATTLFQGEPVDSRVIPASIFEGVSEIVPRASFPELTTTTTTTEPAPTTTEKKEFYDDIYVGQQSIKIEKGGFLSHLLNRYNQLCGTNMSLDSFTALLKQHNDPAVVNDWVADTSVKMPAAENWCQ